MKKLFSALLCLLLLVQLPLHANAQEKTERELTGEVTITGTGYKSFGFLQDGNLKNYKTSQDDAAITLTSPVGMGKIYLLFDLEYGEFTVTNGDTGEQKTCGREKFLHTLVDLEALFGAAPKTVTLDFAAGKVRLSEIRVFTPGALPDSVQVWKSPVEGNADLVLFTTHGDDEQLFFAGLLPLYAGEKQCNVQVVYLTDHRNVNKGRVHEMLNGLWAVGVDVYPVFGDFADFRIDDLDKTYAAYRSKYGVSKEELLSFVVEQVRRFRPLVAVGHDVDGEYGHGMHMLYSQLVQESVAAAADPAQFPQSAASYGTWEIPKVYLHLYPENPIVIDYDTPLETFDGLSAFQVTQKYGFPAHESQYSLAMFHNWLYGRDGSITKATQIKNNNPAKFGLFHTSVGEDVQKNDFFENLLTRAQQAEAQRLEAERLEAERLEKERLERLEAEREEQRKEQEQWLQEQLRRQELEAQRKAEQARKRQEALLLSAGIATAAALAALVWIFRKRK